MGFEKCRNLDVKNGCSLVYSPECGQRGNSEDGSQVCCGVSGAPVSCTVEGVVIAID